jgi:DNA polymerase elongation subunit (family B)
MSTYISTALSKDRTKVIVWERNGDNRYHVEYDAPYYFFVEDPDGKYKTIKGTKVKKLTFDSPKDFFNSKKRFQEEGIATYESDISPELKVLSKRYYNKPVDDQLHITFYDIEVDYTPQKGHAGSSKPYARISSIALYHLHSDRSIVLAIPPKKGDWKNATIKDLPESLRNSNVEIKILKNEKELLAHFYSEIEDSDVISGWNSEFFDDPYVYLRTSKVLGKNCTTLMNLPGADSDVKLSEKENYGRMELTVNPVGRIWIDYMQMVRKFDANERSSYALEAVAEEELDDMDKLDFGKSLYRLYHEDFDKFIQYNIRDTEILKGLEAKFKYMDLAIQFSHMVTNHMKSVLGTVSTSDTAILNFCKYESDEKFVLPDANRDAYTKGKFAGAFVLEPQVGMHEYIGSVDIKSLYPSGMRAINISPDTIIGQFFENTHAWEGIKNCSDSEFTILYENEMDETFTGKEWNKVLKERNWSISAHGTVFDQNNTGIVPAILSSWFEDRIKMQQEKYKHSQMMDKYEKDSSEYIKHKKLVDYYDNIQYLKKIQLNSMYGVFGNKYFRFFDTRLAESTTKSGKEILMHMGRTVAEIMDGEYKYPSPSVLYGDTDSIYFSTQSNNKNDAKTIADSLTKIINKSYPNFMQSAFNCTDGREKYILAEREVISDKGIFVAKKYYMLHLVDLDGKDIDKMKVMGLQIKKTSLPKYVRDKLTNIFERFLKGEDWNVIKKEIVTFKKELENMPILQLGIPSGVKKVEQYTKEYAEGTATRIPGHVQGSIFYNACVEAYEDGESMQINSGMKIRKYYFYKQKKFGKFTSICIPTDMDIMPEWLDNFIPYMDAKRQIKTLVDLPITNILNAIGEPVPNAKNVLADELLEF